jgi:hypothetical protein
MKQTLCFFGLAVSAFAQIDGSQFATDLRAKYGPPLARETFTARPGIEMIVDYAANGHVCRIQLPAIAPLSRDPPVSSPLGIDEFVLELVLLSIRGSEVGRMSQQMSLAGVSTMVYQYVTIGESLLGQKRTGVTITFTKEQCRDQPAP